MNSTMNSYDFAMAVTSTGVTLCGGASTTVLSANIPAG